MKSSIIRQKNSILTDFLKIVIPPAKFICMLIITKIKLLLKKKRKKNAAVNHVPRPEL